MKLFYKKMKKPRLKNSNGSFFICSIQTLYNNMVFSKNKLVMLYSFFFTSSNTFFFKEQVVILYSS